ncbi:response regulator [Rufibacter roseus]|uniref:Response regulator n=1 Tax=Rufibacter roseus TaxID=1567108 RepID=A0ABW2DP83_9BACT|nr:response regulator transcription factor [Rufibacter roseus]
MHKIKVLLADDHNLVRNGIRSLLDNQEDIEIVGEAQNGAEALAKVQELAPHVLMIDIAMPVMNGLVATEKLQQQNSPCKSLILSMHHNEDYILKSVQMGAHGYLLKDTSREEMLQAIRAVARGEKYFSPSVSQVIVASYLEQMQKVAKPAPTKAKLSKKEKAVLVHLIEGNSSREIAEKLNLSTRTVDNHRANMMRRLGVKNAVELVRKALAEKLV